MDPVMEIHPIISVEELPENLHIMLTCEIFRGKPLTVITSSKPKDRVWFSYDDTIYCELVATANGQELVIHEKTDKELHRPVQNYLRAIKDGMLILITASTYN